MMRLHYIVFAIVAITGLGATWLLLPSNSETGLIHLKEKRLDTARATFEELLKKGDYSLDVVMPLVDIYLQYGETDKAIQLLEKFSDRGNSSPEVITKLAQVNRAAVRLPEYMHALETLAQAQHNPETLRQLAPVYRYFDRRDSLARMLEWLAESGKATDAELAELAQIKASAGDPASAMETLKRLDQLKHGKLDRTSLELWVRLLIDTGKQDEAFRRAQIYTKAHPDAESVRYFSSVFARRGLPRLGLDVLQQHPDLTSDPEYLKDWIDFEVALGQNDRAWSQLESKYRNAALDERLLGVFTQLALKRNRPEDAFSAGAQHRFETVPPLVLASLTEAFFLHGNQQRVTDILRLAGTDFLMQQPLLGARIGIQTGDTALASRFMTAAAASTQPIERLALADLYIGQSRPDAARSILSATRFDGLDPSAASAVSDAWMRVGAAAEGADQLGIRGASTPTDKLFVPWLLLTLAAGRDQEALEGLQHSGGVLPEVNTWRDLFHVAFDHKCLRSAVFAAGQLFSREPSDANRELLGQVSFAAGNYQQALAAYRPLRGRNAGTYANYVASLLAAAGPKPVETAGEIRSELVTYWTTALQKPDEQKGAMYALLDLREWNVVLPALETAAASSEELIPLLLETCQHANAQSRAIAFVTRRLETLPVTGPRYESLVWWLIESAGKRTAEPYVMALAGTGSENWIENAVTLLDDSGRSAEAREFILKNRNRFKQGGEVEQRMAYRLLTVGDLQGGAQLLFRNASAAGPDEQRTRDVVELAGRTNLPDIVAWLKTRAETADSDTRPHWLHYLLQVNAPSAVLDVIGQQRHDRVATVVAGLDAASRLHLPQTVEQLSAEVLQRASDTPTLRAAARALTSADLLAKAEYVWSRVLAADGSDAEALRFLAVRASARGETEKALGLFARWERQRDLDASTALSYAELLRSTGRTIEATHQFQLALMLAQANPSASAEAVRAYALFRLNRVSEAFAAYDALRSSGALSSDFGADYAALLLESGASDRALEVARSCANKDDNLRCRLLEAEILASKQHLNEAVAAAGTAVGKSGRDPQALASLASLSERLGRERAAASLLSEAADKNRDDRRLAESLRRIMLSGASRVHAETELRTISGFQQQLWNKVDGSINLNGAVRLLLSDNTVTFKNASGAPAATRSFGEAGVEWRGMNGLDLQTKLSATGRGIGVSGALGMPDERGRTDIRVQYARPAWDIAELLSVGGVRDALELERSYTLPGATVVRGIAALRQYRSIETAEHSTASWGVATAVQHRLTRKADIFAEYMLDTERRLETAPSPFLVNREVHAGSVSGHKSFGKYIDLIGTAGLSADRLGGSGPFWAVEASGQPRAGARFQLFVDRRRYTQSTTHNATRVGGGLTWRF